MKRLAIPLPETKISELCSRWQITELALFGSSLRDDFRTDSDLDMLVTFNPEAKWSLLDFIRLEHELEEIFQRKVDLVIKQIIEESDNWLRKEEILKTAQTIYVA